MTAAPSVTEPEGRSRAELRAIGSYYTSTELARLLTQWAIPTPDCSAAIDPTFGGCAFLAAALERYESLGVSDAGGRVFGVDVDPAVAPFVADLRARGVPQRNLVSADFLEVSPDHFGHAFGAVVGNPPYVRHHRLDGASVDLGQVAASAAGVGLSRTADLWAYVVVHSLRFLAPSGRLALLLPGASLHADYATPVLERLTMDFRRVDLLLVRDRLFSDASERTVVLLADGFSEGPCDVRNHRVSDVRAIARFLTAYGSAAPRAPEAELKWGDRLVQLPAKTADERRAASLFRTCVETLADPMGELGRVRIGTVTGANKFFVRPVSEVGDFLRTAPIISRSGCLQSPIWKAEDQVIEEQAGRPTRLLMISPTDLKNASPAADLVAEGERLGLDKGHHCSKRSHWYALDPPAVPDAFIPYMGVHTPRLVINAAEVSSTNSTHGIDWNEPSSGRCAVLSSWTTLFSLALELFGRAYGKGVLKVEPSAVKALPILRLESSRGLAEIDRIARKGGPGQAMAAADRRILRDSLGLSAEEIRLLGEWQAALQAFRLRTR